jgi:hypothetical protein
MQPATPVIVSTMLPTSSYLAEFLSNIIHTDEHATLLCVSATSNIVERLDKSRLVFIHDITYFYNSHVGEFGVV